jgi:GAF domain-containing protein
MSTAGDPTSATAGPGFARELDQLRFRIDVAQQKAADAADPMLLQDLETAYEELRVADEEIRAQQEQIAALVENQHLLRWQHERMMSMLPVPALITDGYGRVRALNAAAAQLLNVGVSRAVGKPLAGFVSTADRSSLRRMISRAAQTQEYLREIVTITPRHSGPVAVECSVGLLPGSQTELRWTLLRVHQTEETQGPPLGGDLAEALARLAGLPVGFPDRQSLLHQAAEIADGALGKGISLTISVGPPDSPEAVSSTSQLAQSVDGAQLAAGEGPCSTAFDTEFTVVSNDIHHDPRWPRLAPTVDPEVRAVLAVPLEVGEELVGALNIYAEAELSAEVVEAAELIAATLAAVLQEFSTREELQGLARDMEAALTSRATIDQAKGIVMAERGVGPDQAFQHLVDLSSTTHTKLREVAENIVRAVQRSS